MANDNEIKVHKEIADLAQICRTFNEEKKQNFPAQEQTQQPGIQQQMFPQPVSLYDSYQPANKLKDKVVLITGADSGIGRAIAYHAALEGAKIAFTYLNEVQDAADTEKKLSEFGIEYCAFAKDLSEPNNCKIVTAEVIKKFNRIDILINNIAEQHPQDNFLDISSEQLTRTFQTNIFSYFYLTQAVLPHLSAGSSIINTASITAYRGSKHLIDYAASKGAVIAYTRSLAKNLMAQKIRVNAVAPGPVWTPLIPASFSAEEVAMFGNQVPMHKAAQPADIAPCYIFLASADSGFMTGQVLHPNGGEAVNG